MIIDISQYNTITDWLSVSNNADGIIMRIGYRGYGSSGSLNLDKKFKEYLNQCIVRGIDYGVYFVTQAISTKEALDECLFINKNVDISDCKLGVWLDSEYSTHPNHKGRGDIISKNQRTKNANVFFDYFNTINVLNGLYAGDYWIADMMHENDLKCRNLWVPRYGKNDGTISKMPEHDFYMHQYTSVGKISGVKGGVDMSYINKDYDNFNLPNLNGYGLKITEGLQINGYDSSFDFRSKIAKKLGIKNYTGTSEQNIKMIELLR